MTANRTTGLILCEPFNLLSSSNSNQNIAQVRETSHSNIRYQQGGLRLKIDQRDANAGFVRGNKPGGVYGDRMADVWTKLAECQSSLICRAWVIDHVNQSTVNPER